MVQERLSIRDLNIPAPVMDATLGLENYRGFGNAWSSGAEHITEELLREG